ncbi:NUDIX hydrolase [Microvenator marinus]|uniref:NUDIX hydrolase n=1 Tax=Microvenator marinus TaxID=2600177 RepID=A0A5B8XVW4_9DELT|nr:NUDIX hydrolase [Microvenator marinus]QED28243.1 NUDIX hydrolase [Microvenator marinus]
MSSAWGIIHHNSHVLFIRRSFEVGRGGQWCPPGGTMWRNETPEVACVREVYEETGLRVSIQRPIAKFDSAHYILCKLNNENAEVTLRPRECIDSRWVSPKELLTLGTVMDLRRIIPVLQMAELATPRVPDGLKLSEPDPWD